MSLNYLPSFPYVVSVWLHSIVRKQCFFKQRVAYESPQSRWTLCCAFAHLAENYPESTTKKVASDKRDDCIIINGVDKIALIVDLNHQPLNQTIVGAWANVSEGDDGDFAEEDGEIREEVAVVVSVSNNNQGSHVLEKEGVEIPVMDNANAMCEANTNLVVVESSQMDATMSVQSPSHVEVQFNDVMSADQVLNDQEGDFTPVEK
ncbi:hypothetical protein NE237_008254 [Protea cynaroides]|uniref:Uncharacterized protein n=1 Tax=Protea cynaroides TaxID=273540 RepID=A0A9Q0GMR3_9MAGN|nr:hypothetical protein NE237_008254 [Protea cynaroides]